MLTTFNGVRPHLYEYILTSAMYVSAIERKPFSSRRDM